jgi:hypothetical protein
VQTPAVRIKDEVVRALAQVSAVRAIASFGSVAAGRSDEWSDVDLFVACDDVERAAWLAASAIRQAKPVLFYRTFSVGQQPSGRYWFADESPFNRLDVSFYSPDGFEVVCRDALHADHPVTVRSEYVRVEQSTPPPGTHLRPIGPLDITPAEQAIGRLLYMHLEAAKAHRRTDAGKWDVRETRAALIEALSAQPVTMGGDFQRLARAAIQLTDGVGSQHHLGAPPAQPLERM